MYAEGETELRDLIIQNLESSGFLNKIKAELRAGVFIAFEEEGSLRTKIPLFNKKFDEFIDTSNGKLAISLVREFLEFFNLNFTLSVFDPEISTSSPCLNRAELCDRLNIKALDLDGPVISALLKTKLISSGKEDKSSSDSSLLQSTVTSSLNSKKSLETISEDSSSKDKSGLGNLLSKDAIADETSTTFNIGNSSLNLKAVNENFTINQKPLDIAKKSSGSEMIDKLRNEHNSSLLSNSVSDIFGTDKSETNIFKTKVDLGPDLDTFFDEPVPSEKQSYFGLKDAPLTKPSEKKLSSLKDLPALTTPKSKDWSFGRELPSFDLVDSEKKVREEEHGGTTKNEIDPESNEESSDRQMISEESIEEDIEEDSSGGLDDLLHSSLSLADDATTDQSASQISVVDGIDHMESVTN